MYNKNLVNTPAKHIPYNLGFRIPPDITIEFVKLKSEPTDSIIPTTHTEDKHKYNNVEDDNCNDNYEPYFDPLALCTITMDDEDSVDKNLIETAKIDLSKLNKRSVNTQSNENSSFVCNGSNAKSVTNIKNKKRHACHLCPKTFGWTTDLKRHLLIHTGERPFKCNMCSATFTRNFLLQKHKTNIHSCLSPNEISQLNNNVAKNLLEIKMKMRELESMKDAKKLNLSQMNQIASG